MAAIVITIIAIAALMYIISSFGDTFGDASDDRRRKSAFRVRELIEMHPKEVFTLDKVARRLGEKNKGKVVYSLSCLVKSGDIRCYGKGRYSLYGVKEEIIKKLEWMPETLEEARKMNTYDFQEWVFCLLDAERSPRKRWVFGLLDEERSPLLDEERSPRKSKDNGIYGWLNADGSPIQVKRSDGVGKDDINQFENAIRRDGKNTGMFIAFSFTQDAKNEVIRAKKEDGFDIKLKEVENFFRGKY